MSQADFRLYCQNASDTMLEGILEKEWEASYAKGKNVSPGVISRRADYDTAAAVAAGRGWFVEKGVRVS